MTDITVIILVGKEKIHMRRCMEKLAPLEPKQIFVIESQPPDGTREIAESFGAKVVFHPWPGLYAKQFNWALDYVEESSGWILRLDADEYLTPETIEKLRLRLKVEVDGGGFPPDVAGVTLELRRKFCGGEIRHGTNGIRLLRIWRTGKGRSEERAMDEHIQVGRFEKFERFEGCERLVEWRLVEPGKVIDFDGAFYDDNLNDMDWWREKHRGYAKREAADAIAFARGEIRFKPMKERYYRMPRYLRAFVYFGIRYFLKGGFLDGYAGWMWNFWQGLWYRLLVDREIGRQGRV